MLKLMSIELVMPSQRIRCLDGIIDSMDTSLSKYQDIVKDRKAWHAAVHGFAEGQT